MEGIDEGPVTAFLVERLELSPPLCFELIAGGRSNLTFKVTDSARRVLVLRRPPVSHVLPTAHDVAREYRIISSLFPTPVPVPAPRVLCEDAVVNEAPFYVMDFVDGHVLRDETAALQLAEPARRATGVSLAAVLAGLHAVDIDEVGLGSLGRREGYLHRQLARWHGQFDKSQLPHLERAVAVDRVYERLVDEVPEQAETTIVHGDYRLDNTVIDEAGTVRAVLDWELCTLGDPLADVGLMLVYWSEPGDSVYALSSSPTLAPGFVRRTELIGCYEDHTGRDLSDLAYYVAFGYWKLACILQGVFARYSGGAAGGDRSGVDMFASHVRALAGAAEVALGAP